MFESYLRGDGASSHLFLFLAQHVKFGEALRKRPLSRTWMSDNWKQLPGDPPDEKGDYMNSLQHSQSASAYQQQYQAASYQSAAGGQYGGSGWGQLQDGSSLGGGGYPGGNSNSYYQGGTSHHNQQMSMMQGSDPSMMQQQQAIYGTGSGGGSHGFDMQQYQQHQQQQQYMLQQMIQSQQMYPSQGAMGSGGFHGSMSYYGSDSGIHDPSVSTSSSMFGRKPSRPKKNKDKPKRPLSAYNIFFKDQRALMLAGKSGDDSTGKNGKDDKGTEEAKAIKTEDDGPEDSSETTGTKDDGEGEKQSKKRKREPHGKVSFETMAKTIGARWKEISPDELEKYKALAAEDMKRYKKEMDAFLLKQRQGLEESRDQLEPSTVGGGDSTEKTSTTGDDVAESTQPEESSNSPDS